MNHRELALGTKTRSGDQWDVWESVYSPVGADGYPKPIWDKLTGKIDKSRGGVLEGALRPLVHPASATGRSSAPKLRGKMRIYVGDMDNYYLNNAVYLVEEGPEEAQPAGRCGGGLRRSRRALLERRPHARQRVFTPALCADDVPVVRRADAGDGAGGSGSEELAVLRESVMRRRGARGGRTQPPEQHHS